MKKIIVFAFISFPLFAIAQFNKGDVFIGGNVSVLSQDNSAPTTNAGYTAESKGLSVSPTIGFFLNQKFVLGGTISYSGSSQEYKYTFNSNQSTTKYNGLGIGTFARYYLPISNSFYFSLHGQLSFNRGTNKISQTTGGSTSDSASDNYNLGLSFKPVFIFFPSPKWGLEASVGSIGYNYFRNLPDASHTSTFGLNAGSFSFGLAYYFLKK